MMLPGPAWTAPYGPRPMEEEGPLAWGAAVRRLGPALSADPAPAACPAARELPGACQRASCSSRPDSSCASELVLRLLHSVEGGGAWAS